MIKAWKVLTLGVVLALGMTVLGGAQDKEWFSLGDAPLEGGEGLTTVGIGNGACIIEAQNKSDPPELSCYILGESWRSTITLEELSFRNGTSMAWDGDSLYALEGARYEDVGDASRHGFFRINPESGDVTALAQTPGPQGAGNALTYSASNERVYAFTGNKEAEHRFDFAYYDLKAQVWESDISMPDWQCTDDGASLAAVNGTIYALKGECSEDYPNGDFARYDIEADSWEESLPEIPVVGCGVGDGGSLAWSKVEPNFIYATGGGCANEDPGDSFWRYNIAEAEWTELPSLRCPVGHYNGSRLAPTDEGIIFWQGAPETETWECKDGGIGGDAFFIWPFEPIEI